MRRRQTNIKKIIQKKIEYRQKSTLLNRVVKKFDDFIDEENIQNDENLKRASKPKFISNRTGLIERKEDNVKIIERNNATPKINKRQKKRLGIAVKNDDMQDRMKKRLGVNVDIINVDTSKKYLEVIKNNSDVDYDIIIIIPSKDRYDNLCDILNKIFVQESKYTFKIIILNDGSDDVRYSLLSDQYPDITYLLNDINNGKKKYWITINKLFNEAKKYRFKYLIQIDDDFILCDSFINKVVDEYLDAKKTNEKVVCLSYHLMNLNDCNINRWGMKYWVDGGGLYDYNFLNHINFKIDNIYESRWSYRKNLSSGVWQQISGKINKLGFVIQKTQKSLVLHSGFNDSKMHPEFRKKHTIKTVNHE